MTTDLSVSLYGTVVATLSRGTAGRLAWEWTVDAADRWGLGARVVAHLLPISTPSDVPSPAVVRAVLDGLLPEGQARLNHAMNAGCDPDDTFALLGRYGKDTAGALVLSADDAGDAGLGRYVPLTDEEVATALREADSGAPADPTHRGLTSISLAGMVPKVGLHRAIDGTWHGCERGAPSTWILKVAHDPRSSAVDVVDTEAYALDIARRLGLAHHAAEVIEVAGVRALAVERYDRRINDGIVGRIHQEDGAQALGLNTGDPLRKFQRGGRLPSWRSIAKALRDGGGDQVELARLVTFRHAIGDTDCHAKNVSMLRLPDGRARLAPAYDCSMYLHHPGPHLSAMDVDSTAEMDRIGGSELVVEARSWGLTTRRARTAVADTLDQMVDAVEAIELREQPGVSDEAVDTVLRRVALLRAGI